MNVTENAATGTLAGVHGSISETSPNMMANTDKKIKPGTKRFHIVNLLSQGERLHCLMRDVTHDSCLHSTVSGIERDLGLSVSRAWAVRRGWGGSDTRVMVYWLDPAERSQALKLLGDVE